MKHLKVFHCSEMTCWKCEFAASFWLSWSSLGCIALLCFIESWFLSASHSETWLKKNTRYGFTQRLKCSREKINQHGMLQLNYVWPLAWLHLSIRQWYICGLHLGILGSWTAGDLLGLCGKPLRNENHLWVLLFFPLVDTFKNLHLFLLEFDFRRSNN